MPWLPADILDGPSARTLRIDARGQLGAGVDAGSPFTPSDKRWSELLAVLGAEPNATLRAFVPGQGRLVDVVDAADHLASSAPRIAMKGDLTALDYTPRERVVILNPVLDVIATLKGAGYVSLDAGDPLDLARSSLSDTDRPLFDATLAVILATLDQEDGLFLHGPTLLGPLGEAATELAQMLVSDPSLRAQRSDELAKNSNLDFLFGDLDAAARITVARRAIALFAMSLQTPLAPVIELPRKQVSR